MERVGGPHPIVGGDKFNAKKKSNKKFTVTLGGRRSMNLHTTTNQKKELIMEERRIGGVTVGGVQGGVSPLFGGHSSKIDE